MDGDTAHFITLSFWESRDAIVAFAGANIEVAKYYAEDEKYLLEFEPTVTHYELFPSGFPCRQSRPWLSHSRAGHFEYQSECSDHPLHERHWGLRPLVQAGGAHASRVERVPAIAARAKPFVFFAGRPAA